MGSLSGDNEKIIFDQDLSISEKSVYIHKQNIHNLLIYLKSYK